MNTRSAPRATPKVTEMLPRWKLFPREIENDLSLYHHRDIGEWFEGTLSSRKLLTYLDGLPNDSWYKLRVLEYMEEVRAANERAHARDVHGLIFAQLTGQTVEVTDG